MAFGGHRHGPKNKLPTKSDSTRRINYEGNRPDRKVFNLQKFQSNRYFLED